MTYTVEKTVYLIGYVSACKRMLIRLLLAHCHTQMWTSALHTCIALSPLLHDIFTHVVMPLTALVAVQNKTHQSWPTSLNKPLPKKLTKKIWQTHETYSAALWETFWRPVKIRFTLSDTLATFIDALSFANKPIHSLSVSLSSINNIRTCPHDD